MRPSILLLALAGLGLLGCQQDAKPEAGGIGGQLADITSDTAVMKEAQAASNELVRNAQDCDAVKASLAEVNRKLDEAAQHVRTETGKTTLAALRSRVSSIAQACP
jgi:hypothetical protein